MRLGIYRTKDARRLSLLLAIATLSGCATNEIQPPPPAEEPPAVVIDEVEIPITPAPPPVPEAEPPPVIVAPLPSVAIVLANRAPAYERVVEELSRHFERYYVYDLTDKSQPASTAFRLINDSDTAAVIAIGMQAARTAVALSGPPVIFGQVFNYQDFGLITESSRGVAAIAPFDAQLAAWRNVEPEVSRIGVILGEGHEDLIAEARAAAAAHSVQLTVRVTQSDQETLYLFKRMAPDIDGFWLLPDNRVLSARVIREILDDARHRGITAVVPAESMLSLGAAISITTEPADIAARIASIVREIEAGRFADVPAMTPLSELRITTNDAVLRNRVAQSAVETVGERLQ